MYLKKHVQLIQNHEIRSKILEQFLRKKILNYQDDYTFIDTSENYVFDFTIYLTLRKLPENNL